MNLFELGAQQQAADSDNNQTNSGLNLEEFDSESADQNITQQSIAAGESIEPNQGLEGSMLDPLTTVLGGTLIGGAVNRLFNLGTKVRTNAALNTIKKDTDKGIMSRPSKIETTDSTIKTGVGGNQVGKPATARITFGNATKSQADEAGIAAREKLLNQSELSKTISEPVLGFLSRVVGDSGANFVAKNINKILAPVNQRAALKTYDEFIENYMKNNIGAPKEAAHKAYQEVYSFLKRSVGAGDVVGGVAGGSAGGIVADQYNQAQGKKRRDANKGNSTRSVDVLFNGDSNRTKKDSRPVSSVNKLFNPTGSDVGITQDQLNATIGDGDINEAMDLALNFTPAGAVAGITKSMGKLLEKLIKGDKLNIVDNKSLNSLYKALENDAGVEAAAKAAGKKLDGSVAKTIPDGSKGGNNLVAELKKLTYVEKRVLAKLTKIKNGGRKLDKYEAELYERLLKKDN